MAVATKQSHEGGEKPHRGRIQAQGGGIEKSVRWAQDEAPTLSEMLKMCDRLEAMLTDRERKERERPLADLRRCIRAAAERGGFSTPFGPPRSFQNRTSRDRTIRIDLEVINGKACVPDRK